MAVPKNPAELEVVPPFRELFPIEPAVRELVTNSIRANGYDMTQPILAWRDAFGDSGRAVVIDGHTRRAVAIDLKLPTVPVTMRRYGSLDEALTAAVVGQAHRRNLNQSQLVVFVLSALATLDDGGGGQGSRNDLRGRSARQLSELLGVGTSTIERARKLIDLGDDELLRQVKAGDVSLKAAVERGKHTADPAPEPEPEPEGPAAPPRDTRKGDEIPTHEVRVAWVDYENSTETEVGQAAEDLLVRALGRKGFDKAVAEREERAERRRQEAEAEADDETEPEVDEPEQESGALVAVPDTAGDDATGERPSTAALIDALTAALPPFATVYPPNVVDPPGVAATTVVDPWGQDAFAELGADLANYEPFWVARRDAEDSVWLLNELDVDEIWVRDSAHTAAAFIAERVASCVDAWAAACVEQLDATAQDIASALGVSETTARKRIKAGGAA